MMTQSVLKSLMHKFVKSAAALFLATAIAYPFLPIANQADSRSVSEKADNALPDFSAISDIQDKKLAFHILYILHILFFPHRVLVYQSA